MGSSPTGPIVIIFGTSGDFANVINDFASNDHLSHDSCCRSIFTIVCSINDDDDDAGDAMLWVLIAVS
jgi:hypothetical protein